jgi:hypothetical protein
MNGLPWFAKLLLALAGRLMPSARREWAEAMSAEMHYLPRDAALSWAAGCLIAALKQRYTHMLKGNLRVSRWVMLFETLGCFGPAALAWWEFTFGLSGWVRLSPALVGRVFLDVPGGGWVFGLWLGFGVAAMVSVIGLGLGLRHVLTGRALRSRGLGYSLIAVLVLHSVAATLGRLWLGGGDFALRAEMFVLLTLLPVAGLVHLMYLARADASPGARADAALQPVPARQPGRAASPLRRLALPASVAATFALLFVSGAHAGDVMLDVGLSLDQEKLDQRQLVAAEGRSSEIMLEGQLRLFINPMVTKEGAVLLSMRVEEPSGSRWVRVSEPRMLVGNGTEASLKVTTSAGREYRIVVTPMRM